MGTELQIAVNLLASSSPNPSGFIVHSVDAWEVNLFLEKGLRASMKRSGLENTPQVPMDRRRLLEQNNIESIKRTMLMQEETFQLQVGELHRLYGVQKMLMTEVRDRCEEANFHALNTGSTINDFLFNHQHQTICGNNVHYIQSVREDPTLCRQTVSCSSVDAFRSLSHRGFQYGRKAEENNSTAASVMEDGLQTGPSSHVLPQCDDEAGYEDAEVELTLSIGGSTTKRRSKTPRLINREDIRQMSSSVSFNPDDGEEYREHAQSNTNSTSTSSLDVERQQSHWLFQGLSLNRT